MILKIQTGINMDNNSNNVSGNGNFCINNSGTINLNNSNASHSEYTQLKETGIKNNIQRKDVIKKLREQSIVASIPVIIAVLANFTNVLQYIGIGPFPHGQTFIFLLGCLVFPFILSKTLVFNLWHYLFKQNSKNFFLLHNGNYYFLSKDRDYVEEKNLSANCIYPSCNGKIFLKVAPPREKDRNIIGCCTIDEKNHTYSLDNNFVVYKCQMDSRPITNNTTQ